ncbi:MAG: YfbM family protein [Sandaracinaceae bacterium]|nr:YfbM family protein [Sandaracinaceae bacterium]
MGIRCTLIARPARGSTRRLRLDKAWDALEVLLTGGRGVPGGIGDAVTGRGGRACEPHGAFGPSRCLSRARIEAIAEALVSLDEATIRARLPLLATLEVHGAYGRRPPDIDPAVEQLLREEGFGGDEDMLEDEHHHLAELVAELTDFYREARDEGDEVIVSIG